MGEYRTDFLFPSGSILIGAATVFSLGGQSFIYNTSRGGFAADERATRSDWGVIGQDIRDAVISERFKVLSANVESGR